MVFWVLSAKLAAEMYMYHFCFNMNTELEFSLLLRFRPSLFPSITVGGKFVSLSVWNLGYQTAFLASKSNIAQSDFFPEIFPAPIPFRKKEKQDKDKDEFIPDRYGSLQGLQSMLLFSSSRINFVLFFFFAFTKQTLNSV